MKFLAAATTLVIFKCTAALNSSSQYLPSPAANNSAATTTGLNTTANLTSTQNISGSPPPAQNVSGAPPVNGTNTTGPKIITMNCTQAFMPLQADDNSTQAGGNASTAINITEAGCKAFDTPDGAYCQAESCAGLPTCQNCNLLIPGATPNDTTISNTTTPSVQCASNYFLPELNDTNRQALCTDAKSQSYSCTGACNSFATCEVCISMDDPALQDNSTTGGSPNSTSTGLDQGSGNRSAAVPQAPQRA